MPYFNSKSLLDAGRLANTEFTLAPKQVYANPNQGVPTMPPIDPVLNSPVRGLFLPDGQASFAHQGASPLYQIGTLINKNPKHGGAAEKTLGLRSSFNAFNGGFGNVQSANETADFHAEYLGVARGEAGYLKLSVGNATSGRIGSSASSSPMQRTGAGVAHSPKIMALIINQNTSWRALTDLNGARKFRITNNNLSAVSSPGKINFGGGVRATTTFRKNDEVYNHRSAKGHGERYLYILPKKLIQHVIYELGDVNISLNRKDTTQGASYIYGSVVAVTGASDSRFNGFYIYRNRNTSGVGNDSPAFEKHVSAYTGTYFQVDTSQNKWRLHYNPSEKGHYQVQSTTEINELDSPTLPILSEFTQQNHSSNTPAGNVPFSGLTNAIFTAQGQVVTVGSQTDSTNIKMGKTIVMGEDTNSPFMIRRSQYKAQKASGQFHSPAAFLLKAHHFLGDVKTPQQTNLAKRQGVHKIGGATYRHEGHHLRDFRDGVNSPSIGLVNGIQTSRYKAFKEYGGKMIVIPAGVTLHIKKQRDEFIIVSNDIAGNGGGSVGFVSAVFSGQISEHAQKGVYNSRSFVDIIPLA